MPRSESINEGFPPGRRRPQRGRPTRPLGFRKPSEPSPPSILIATYGPVEGHDICVFTEAPTRPITVDRPICCLYVDELTPELTQSARDSGLAFVTYRPSMSRADAILETGVDYCLNLSDGIPDPAEARALAMLRPMLVVLPMPALPLSIADLLKLRRAAVLLNAPFGLHVPADISSGDLEALRDSGLAAVLLDPATEESVGELRDRILALPRRERGNLPADVQASLPTPSSFDDDMDDGW